MVPGHLVETLAPAFVRTEQGIGEVRRLDRQLGHVVRLGNWQALKYVVGVVVVVPELLAATVEPRRQLDPLAELHRRAEDLWEGTDWF